MEVPRPELVDPEQQEVRSSIPFERLSAEIADQLKKDGLNDAITNDPSTEKLEATLSVIDAGKPALPRTVTTSADSLGQWIVGQTDQLLGMFEHGAPAWSKDQGIQIDVAREGLILFSLHVERTKP